MSEEKNINLVLKNPDDYDKPILTLGGILSQVKRFFVLWIVISMIAAIVTGCGTFLLGSTAATAKAMVEFTFDGIERGKDPAGNEFEIQQIKSPAVIEGALDALMYADDEVDVDSLRNNIKIESVTPSDAIDKMAAYKSVFDIGNNAAMNAVEEMLDVSVYPTRFIITLDLKAAKISKDDGARVLDAILDSYKRYFYETYGYNRALGSAVLAIDYHDYDYERAIDVFDSTLESAQKYVSALANQDSTSFRSTTTGYSFSDLSSAIGTLRSEDLGWISSYVTVNNVTKDKDMLLTFYQYTIDNLKRKRTAAESNLKSVEASIEKYQKDTVMVMAGANSETANLTLSQSSPQYDQMIDRKLATQAEIAECTKEIDYYEGRIESLKSNAGSATKTQMETLDAQLDSLYQKTNNILELVETTADEFYENVAFTNAYSIIVPSTVENEYSLPNVVIIIAVVEILIFLIFAMMILVRAFTNQYNINNGITPVSKTKAADVKADDEKSENKNDSKSKKGDK